MKITIYSGDNCKNCESAKQFFNENNINYVEYNINKDIEAKKNLIKKRIMSVPFIIIDNDEFIGFTDEVKEKIWR